MAAWHARSNRIRHFKFLAKKHTAQKGGASYFSSLVSLKTATSSDKQTVEKGIRMQGVRIESNIVAIGLLG